jgi:hypothetical protein
MNMCIQYLVNIAIEPVTQTAGVEHTITVLHGLVAHIVHDTVFLIIKNTDYTIGYKASHPQTDLQKLLQKSKHGLTLHTFDLYFCTLILFSVITLNFNTNFLICIL